MMHLWSVKVMMWPRVMMSWVEIKAVLCRSGLVGADGVICSICSTSMLPYRIVVPGGVGWMFCSHGVPRMSRVGIVVSHHGTAVENCGGIVRACWDILWVGLSAYVVVGRLLVILLWRRGASCAGYWGCFFLAEGSKVAVEGRGGIA